MAREPRLSQDQVEAVIANALALDASAAEGVTVDELLLIGDELGITRTSMERSLGRVSMSRAVDDGTLVDRIVGPAGVAVERWTMRDADRATTDLSRRLHRFNLTRVDQSVWIQQADWWPDLQRVGAPVVLDVRTEDGSDLRPSVLRVRARLDGARRTHLGTALAGVALIPLWMIGLATPLLAGTGLGIALGAIGFYRLRLHDLERCVVTLLDRVAAPVD